MRASNEDERVVQRDSDARGPVTPLPMGIARALVEGARAVTLTAGIAAAVLLGLFLSVGIANEEVLDIPALEVLFRGLAGGLLISMVFGIFGEFIRRALARATLLPDARSAAAGTTPPAHERDALRHGPFGFLVVVAGVVLMIAAVTLLVATMLIFEDDLEGFGVVLALVSVAGIVGAIALIRWSRSRGAATARWKSNVHEVASRWHRVVQPVPRVVSRKFGLVVRWGIVASVVGMLALMFGLLMRRPSRNSPDREWGTGGEALIDIVVVVSSSAFAIGALLLLVNYGTFLVKRTLRDSAVVRALERGERVSVEHVDAVLVGPSPMEHVSMLVGVVGWLAVVAGAVPQIMTGVVSAERVAPLDALSIALLPGVVAVMLAWELGRIAAVRARRRRARVHAVLRRDPRPPRDHERSEPDGTTVVRDVHTGQQIT